MIKITHGKVHGKTIELAEDLGLVEGQEVEIQVSITPGERKWGDGILRTAVRSQTILIGTKSWKMSNNPARSTTGHPRRMSDASSGYQHLLRPQRAAGLAHRFFQYGGGLAISTVVLAELYSGAYKHPNSTRLLSLISDFLQEVSVLDFDAACAQEFGKTRGSLMQQGRSIPTADLMIASVALVHDLTLITHNTADYQNIPGLRLEDWLAP